MSNVVIIGSGQAGFETATSLRSKGFEGCITIVGDEPGTPYQRPPLSKAYLHSAVDPCTLELRPRSYFDDHNIDLRCGTPATGIDPDARTVTLGDGTDLQYDHLVLATGARNRLLAVPGSQLPGVHYLRTADEAKQLTDRLDHCGSVLVIGAGFIGLEVAAAARKKGRTVTVVEAADRPMARALTPEMSEYFARLHRDNGVELLLSTGVELIADIDGRAAGVITTTGELISADVVVVGIGVIPNAELAADSGLTVDNGIVVDQWLQTSDPRISAIGDCASYPDPAGRGRVRLESVQNAVDHARCIAARILGTRSAYGSVPWFWSEQYSAKLQIAGLTAGTDATVVRGSLSDNAFSVFCFGGGRLLGVESVNNTRDHMAARKMLAGAMPLTAKQAADLTYDLKAAAAAHSAGASPKSVLAGA